VPPAGGLEEDAGDIALANAVEEPRGPPSFSTTSVAPSQQAQTYAPTAPAFQLNQGDSFAYDAYVANYQKPPFHVTEQSYGNFYPEAHPFQGTISDPYQSTAQTFRHVQDDDKSQRQERAGSSPVDQFTAEDLLDHLGQLKINDTGVADYIRSEKSSKEQDPPLHETEPEPRIAAAFRTDAGSQIRIPPALMPSQEEAIRAFDTYFTNVHPYVPVLNKSQFYHQWQNDPASISPLVLEAIFANAGRLSDDPAQGAQWLALANSRSSLPFPAPLY
jgi:hypothetical protein